MSETNVFSKTSDTKTIIRFVKEIERHPCLYDAKSPKYMDRELKRRTWIYIAKKCNSTVSDCKEKWTKIRTAYIRTLRPSYNDGVRTFSRPYYLANHLRFISPMKKNGACRGKFCSSKSEKSDTGETEANKEESENSENSEDESSQHQVFLNEDNNLDDNDDYDEADVDNDEMEGYINLEIETIDTASNEGNKTKVQASGNRNENETSSCKTDKPKLFTENVECNPRKMFLFSLLPDIEDLNEQQMRVFRRDVIKLIDKVMID